MLPGPIFDIELLTSARRTRFYWIRAIYAAILLLVLWSEFPRYSHIPGAHGSPSIAQMARFAAEYFWSFSLLQVLMVLIVGPALVAPTICVERERRTIEYLLATDLTSAEIVLGKLLARVLGITYNVLVGLPILALAGLLGGIDPQKLLITFAITASTMLAVAALSIAVSVRAARVRRAIGQVYTILIALLLIPLIVQAALAPYGFYDWVAPINDRLLEGNPLTVLSRTVLSSWSGIAPWPAIGGLVLNQAVFTVVLTGFATWSLRRVQTPEAAGGRKQRWKLARRRGAVSDRPILWKERGDNSLWTGGIWSRVVVLLVAVLLIWPIASGFYEHMRQSSPSNFFGFQEMAGSILMMAACGALLLLGARAACSITGEREKDTWTSVLGTPLSADEIVCGKIQGNLNIAFALFWYWALVTLLRVICKSEVAACIPFSLVTGGILTLFCSTLGTYVSLASRSTARALATTVALLLFLGGGYLFCCMPFAGTVARGGEIIFAPCAPFLLFISLSAGAAHSEFERMLAPYLFGTIGYAVATAALYSACVTRFDALNGRVVARYGEDAPNGPGEPLPGAKVEAEAKQMADRKSTEAEPAGGEIVGESKSESELPPRPA